MVFDREPDFAELEHGVPKAAFEAGCVGVCFRFDNVPLGNRKRGKDAGRLRPPEAVIGVPVGLIVLLGFPGGIPNFLDCSTLPKGQVSGEVLLDPAEGLNIEVGASGFRKRVIEERRNLLEADRSEKLLGGFHVLGGDKGDGCARMAGALLHKQIGDLERLPYLLPIIVRLPLQFALVSTAVEPLVILEERRARPAGYDESLPGLGPVNGKRGQKFRRHELVEVDPELLSDDLGPVPENGEPAEPLGADIIVAFCERKLLAIATVKAIGEMEKQSHIKRLADRAEFHHQGVIEAGEVLVLATMQ